MFAPGYFAKTYFTGFYFLPVDDVGGFPEPPATWNYPIYRRARR